MEADKLKEVALLAVVSSWCLAVSMKRMAEDSELMALGR